MSDTKLTDKISEVIIMAIKKTPFFEKVENMLNVVGISILFTGVVTIINYYTLNNINSKICEQNIILKQNVTFLFEKQELLHKKIDKLLEDSKNMNSLLETKNMKVSQLAKKIKNEGSIVPANMHKTIKETVEFCKNTTFASSLVIELKKKNII